MTVNIPSKYKRLFPSLFLVVLLLSSIALVMFAYVYINSSVAIKGVYVSIGCVFSMLVYFGGNITVFQNWRVKLDERQNIKIFFFTFALAFSYLFLFENLELAVVVLFTSVLAFLNIHRMVNHLDKYVIIQSICIFFFSGLAKFSSTGFYFGYFDTLRHVGLISDIVSANRIVRGTGIVSEYYHFPVVHTLVALLRIISSLSPYYGLMLLGVLSFSIGILFVERIMLLITRQQLLATITGFSVVLVPSYHFYSLFPFPQSVAFSLSILFAYLLLLNFSTHNYVFYLVGFSILLTHHLIFIILGMFVGVYISSNTIVSIIRRDEIRLGEHFIIPLFCIFSSSLSYWLIVDENFITDLVWQGAVILNSDLGGGVYTQQSTYLLGVESYDSIAEATTWLMSAWGAHAAILLSFVALGTISIVKSNFKSSNTVWSLFISGLVGSLLLLETPLTFKGNGRISMIWIPAFAFVIGCGIYFILNHRRRTVGSLIGVFLIICAASVAPITSPGNYYGTKEYNIQTKYSTQEYSELRSSAGFIRDTNSKVTTLQIYKPGLSRFGIDTERPVSVSDNQILFREGLYMYSFYSTDYIVYHQSEYLYLDKVLMTKDWLQSSLSQNNVVYNSGKMGLIYSSNGTEAM